MNFYYKGKKPPSKVYDIASGCLMIIGLSAIIFLISLLDSLDDIKEYGFQIVLALLMGGSLLYQLFRKRGKLHTNKVEIKNGYLQINTISSNLKTVQLDIYTLEEKFQRYHLWDSEGKIAIYSIHEDDLAMYFKDELPNNTNYYPILKGTSRDFEYTITTKVGSLSYDTDTGGYKIIRNTKVIASFIPEVFAVDGKYKKSEEFIKKK